jgi:hypothetical protein
MRPLASSWRGTATVQAAAQSKTQRAMPGMGEHLESRSREPDAEPNACQQVSNSSDDSGINNVRASIRFDSASLGRNRYDSPTLEQANPCREIYVFHIQSHRGPPRSQYILGNFIVLQHQRIRDISAPLLSDCVFRPSAKLGDDDPFRSNARPAPDSHIAGVGSTRGVAYFDFRRGLSWSWIDP